MAREKPKTAADVSTELERDPEYQARLARIQANAEAQGAAATIDERAIIAELERAGIQVRSIYDFVNEYATPVEAVPHLLRHLDEHHLSIVRDGILRALAYSHLRSSALEGLKQFFVKSQVPGERWLAANALATMASLAELSADLPGIEDYASLFRGAPRRS